MKRGVGIAVVTGSKLAGDGERKGRGRESERMVFATDEVRLGPARPFLSLCSLLKTM